MSSINLSGKNHGGSLAFPNFNIPEKEKDEDYHKKYIEAITFNSIDSTYDIAYAMMDESVDFYNGLQSGEEFNFLQEAEDGEVLPAVWINFNKIKNKVDVLLGETDKRGYDIRVRAINKEAIIRRREIKEDMRIDMRLNPVAQTIEQGYNIPIGYNPELPQSDEELEEKFRTWQDAAEVTMEYALKYLDKKYKWRYLRIALMRDILIMGRAFVYIDKIDGIPIPTRIDPRDVIFDKNATDDFLSDATYFGIVKYMSIFDAADRFGLDSKEIEEVYQNMKSSRNMFNRSMRVGNGSNLVYFKDEDGELRVLVLTAFWQDYKNIKKRYSKDNNGNEHVKSVSEYATSENVKSKHVRTWRQGTLIGGKILKDWGEMENQVRNIDDLYESDAPIKAILPNWLNKNAISKVDTMKALQKLKNITMYNIQLAMSRAGAKGFVYDIAQIPDEWDIRTVMKYLKVTGIAFIDSQKDNMPAQYNQFQPIDQTLSDNVTRYVEISMLVDREMSAISGINEESEGIIENSYQSVGVNQSALFRSSLATETINAEFQMFSSNVWTHIGGCVKLNWGKNKERFSPIISETGVDFLSQDVDLTLDHFGVFIEEVNPIFNDVQAFQNIIVTALQAQAISFVDAIKLMRERDVTKGIREFEVAVKRREQEMAEAQQAQMMQEHQMEMERQGALAQAQGQNAQIASQGRVQAQGVANQGKLQQEALKGRFDLRGRQIEGLIENANIKQKGRQDVQNKRTEGAIKAVIEANKPRPTKAK